MEISLGIEIGVRVSALLIENSDLGLRARSGKFIFSLVNIVKYHKGPIKMYFPSH